MEGIAAERGKILNVAAGKSTADLSGLGIDGRSDVAADGDGLADVADLQGDVNGLNLFGGDADIGESLLLKAARLGRERIAARSQAEKVINAARVGGDGLRAIGFFVGECNGCRVDGVALRIEHTALDAGAILSKGRKGGKEKSQERHNFTQRFRRNGLSPRGPLV